MSASHHADDRQTELMKRFIEQAEKVGPQREYPRGRLGAEDDGALAFAIAADPKTKTVVINFNKPVKWFGMGPKEVEGLVNLLLAKAREISDVAITIHA